jgi:hypothetical protein
MWSEKTKTFKAGTALEAYRLVRPSASTAGECDYPAAGYKGPLFLTTHYAAADASVTCIPLSGGGYATVMATVAGAVARGARLFLTGAAGKVDDAATATPTGLVALEAATADGEQVECAIVGAGAGAVAYANLADSAQVENTTTETAFDKSVTVDGPSLKAGDVLHIRARVFVEDNNSTDTLNLKLYVGTQEIAATGAVDVADNDIGYIDAMVVVREGGATGKLSASGVTALGVPGTVTAKPFRLAEAAEDLSGDIAITVKATWSVAHADNECELEDLIVLHHAA